MGYPRRFTFSRQFDDYFAGRVQGWLAWLARRKTEWHGGIMDPYKYGCMILVIYCAFWGNPLRAHVATLTVATAILMARDLWLFFLKKGSGDGIDTTTDVLMMAAGLYFSQVYFGLRDSEWATLQFSDLMKGAGVSVIGIWVIRIAFHANTAQNDPGKEPESRLVRSAWRINLMQVLAIMMIAGSNTKAVPIGHLFSFLLAATTIVSFRLIYRLETGVRWTFLETWLGSGILAQAGIYKKGKAAQVSAAALPLPPSRDRRKSNDATSAKIVFTMCMLAPFALAAWYLAFGDPSQIRWRTLASNLIAMALMIPLWRVTKHLNKAVVEAVKESGKE